jgi:hypothetical protein
VEAAAVDVVELISEVVVAASALEVVLEVVVSSGVDLTEVAAAACDPDMAIARFEVTIADVQRVVGGDEKSPAA